MSVPTDDQPSDWPAWLSPYPWWEAVHNLPKNEETPSWSAAVWPWFVVPVLSQCFVMAFISVMRPIHRWLMVISVDRYRKAFVNYVGIGASVNPRRPQLMVLMGIGQLLASMITVVIFIFDAARLQASPEWVRSLEILLGLFLCSHQVLLIAKDEFLFRQPVWGLLNIIDMLTVPQLLFGFRCGWMTLGFLRSHRALRTYERLELLSRIGAIQLFSTTSEVTQRIVSMALRSLAIVLSYSGLIFVIENLGELDWIHETLASTSMGELSFFTVTYWVLETVTTVGYGDYTPKSVLSRCVTMSCMLSGVIVFAVESTKAAELWTAKAQGTGAFNSKKGRHIVLMGGWAQHTDESLLIAFFTELYHRVYKDNWPEVVVLVCTEEAVHFFNSFVLLNVEREAVHLVTVLQGSPLLEADLNRCSCSTASDIYIVSDTSGRSNLAAAEEDKQNILRALSVRRRCANSQVWVVLLTSEAKAIAMDAGIRSADCFAIDELRDCLFSQSTHCRGWSTLLCNLAVTADSAEVEDILMERVEDQSAHSVGWRADYVHGLDLEIYGFLPNRRFWGESFLHMARVAFEEESIILIAAQVEGNVLLSPFKELQVITRSTVLFGLAQDEEALQPLRQNARGSSVWRRTFAENRMRCRIDEEKQTTRTHRFIQDQTNRRNMLLLWERPAPMRVQRQRGSEDILEDVNMTSSVASMPTDNTEWPAPSRLGGPAPSSRARASLVADQLRNRLGDLDDRAQVIRESGETTPFITFIEMSASWRQVARFLMESKGRPLPNTMPTIIMCPNAPSLEVIKELGLLEDPNVGLVVGSVQWVPDLVRAGIKEAACVVCPSPDRALATANLGTPNYEDMLMVDAEGVMLYQMLVGLGIDEKAMTLFEFKHTHNIDLLSRGGHKPDGNFNLRNVGQESFMVSIGDNRRPTPLRATGLLHSEMSKTALLNEHDKYGTWVGDPSERGCAGLCHRLWGSLTRGVKAISSTFNEEGAHRASFGATVCGHPKVIAGQVFTPVSIGCMLARVSLNPGIMQVMQALAMPEARTDMFIWQIRATKSRQGRSYAECWKELLNDPDGPVLALGLYRFLTDEEMLLEDDPPIGYVMTNPKHSVKLRYDDLIYAVAPTAWGRRMYEEGLLLNSARERELWKQEADSEFSSAFLPC